MELTTSYTDGQVKLGLVAATLSLAVLYKLLSTKKSTLPPGPKGWPLIGNLKEFFSCKYFTELFESYSKKHGDVFTVYMGGKPIVVLNSLEKVRETLVEKQNDFAGRPLAHSIDLFTENGKSVVFGDFTEIWKLQRKIAFSAFRKFATGHQLENLVHDSFDKTAVLFEKEKGAFNPMELVSLLVYNIIFNMTCGQNFSLDDPMFKKIIDTVEDINNTFGLGLMADFFPIFKHIPTKGENNLRKANKVIKDYLKEQLDEHRKNYDPENLKDLCDSLISCENEARAEGGNEIMKQMDEYHYINLLSDVVFAGTDTTRYTLLWLIIYMARNPDCQKKLHEEIDTVLGKQQMTMDDRSKLNYTAAVLHETMRIKTLVPFAIPHKTTCDTSVGEYKLPKGTEVWPNLDKLMHDERHWEDPYSFNVGRFLDADGKFSGIPPSFKPFGTGRRVCIGEAVAKSELVMLVAMFFQRFTVSPPDGAEVLDVSVESQIFNFPKPFQVVITKRT